LNARLVVKHKGAFSKIVEELIANPSPSPALPPALQSPPQQSEQSINTNPAPSSNNANVDLPSNNKPSAITSPKEENLSEQTALEIELLKRELNDLKTEFDETSRFLQILQVLHPETTSVVRQFILQQHHRLEYASGLRKEFEREQRKVLSKKSRAPVQKQEEKEKCPAEKQLQEPQQLLTTQQPHLTSPTEQPKLTQQPQLQTQLQPQPQPLEPQPQSQPQPLPEPQQLKAPQVQKEDSNCDKSMEMLKELGFTDEEVSFIFIRPLITRLLMSLRR